MEAAAETGALAIGVASGEAAKWGRMVAFGGLGLVWGVCGLLLVRRMSGALVEPLGGVALLATAALAVLIGVAIRELWRPAARDASKVERRVICFGPTLGVVLLAAALLPGAEWMGSVGFLAITALGEGFAIGTWTRRAPKVRRSRPFGRRPGGPASPPSEVQVPGPEPRASTPEEVLQQMSRTRDAAGQEVLSGVVRAEFQPGERGTALHIAFCPPYAATPQFTAGQAAGPKARLKVGQLQPFGARIDVRLPEAVSETTSVLLEFTAEGQPFQLR